MSKPEVTEDDKVTQTLFNWCAVGQHKDCVRSSRRFLIDPKNKLVWLNEVYQCSCKKRGCECYVKPADRPKPVKKRRRKK